MAERNPDLPTAAPAVMAALAETHQVIAFTPGDDMSLAYRITLPKGWRAETDLGPAPGPFAQPTLIGLFAPAATPDAPFVSVSVTRLPVEVNLEDWLDFICAQEGWQTFLGRWLQGPHGLVADAGATRAGPAGKEIMRAMAKSDSGRIFITSCVAVAGQWDRYKEDFFVAGASFELARPSGDDSLEPLREFEGGEPAFGVAYPGSWQAHPQPPSVPGKSALDVRLISEGQLLAYLLIKATDREAHPQTTLDKLIEESQHELVQSGFLPTDKGVFPAHDLLGAEIPGYEGTAVVRGRLADDNAEARLGYRLITGMAFSYTLLSVRQEDNPLLWMRSKRAFELARQLSWKVDGRDGAMGNGRNK
jgi:hypothetical protein